jgi:hypothetical protein
MSNKLFVSYLILFVVILNIYFVQVYAFAKGDDHQLLVGGESVENDDSANTKKRPTDEETLIKNASVANADYLKLARNYLTKKAKGKNSDGEKEIPKNIVVDCILYKLVKARRSINKEIKSLQAENNKNVVEEIRKLKRKLKEVESRTKKQQKKKTNRHDDNSQWEQPKAPVKKLLKKIKQLNEKDQDNRLEIAKLNTKKFELTESIELRNLKRLKENGGTDSETSFLELKEACEQ